MLRLSLGKLYAHHCRVLCLRSIVQFLVFRLSELALGHHMVLAIAAIGPNAEITQLSILDACRVWTAGTATLWLEYFGINCDV